VTILCEPDPVLAARVSAFIDGVVWTVGNLGGVARVLDEHVEESVVVLGSGTGLAWALDFMSLLQRERPTVSVIILRDPADAGEFVHSGICEVVSTDDLGALAAACRRVVVPAGRPSGGQVVTVFAPTSGYGKTTVAINLAAVLNAESLRVCLVDLDLVYGDMADVLGFRPDQQDFPTVTEVRAGLDCVLASVRPGDPERVPSDAVDGLLVALAAHYDYVVVDTPAQLTTHVLCALDQSHHHVLVATPERPALRNLRHTLDILDLLAYPRAARTVLLNRCDPQVGLTEGEIDALLRSPVADCLPGTVDVPVSINSGVPLAISAPGHPFTRALRRFAGAYVLSGPGNGLPGGGHGAR
jgi:pilus assembly protein CpaE